MVATRLLEWDAEAWWSSIQSRYAVLPTWEEFLREFNKQYYTKYHRDQKIAEFYQLAQGSRTVTEYEAELRELACFVHESERTDDLLAHRFEEGLSPELRAIVGTIGAQDLRTLVTAAEKAERVAAQQRVVRGFRREAEGRRFSPWRHFEPRVGIRSGGTIQTGSSGTQATRSQMPYPQFLRVRPMPSAYSSVSVTQARLPVGPTRKFQCRNYGGNNLPPCPQPPRCYVCNRTRHLARFCPRAGTPAPLSQSSVRPGSGASVRPSQRSAPRQGGSGQASGRTVGRPPHYRRGCSHLQMQKCWPIPTWCQVLHFYFQSLHTY